MLEQFMPRSPFSTQLIDHWCGCFLLKDSSQDLFRHSQKLTQQPLVVISTPQKIGDLHTATLDTPVMASSPVIGGGGGQAKRLRLSLPVVEESPSSGSMPVVRKPLFASESARKVYDRNLVCCFDQVFAGNQHQSHVCGIVPGLGESAGEIDYDLG